MWGFRWDPGQGEYLLIKKYQRVHGLVLGGGCDVRMDGQMGEESFDLRFGGDEMISAFHLVKVDVAFDPMQVSPFRLKRIVMDSEVSPGLIDKTRRIRCGHINVTGLYLY
jgi:hypothetical protein